LRIRAVNPNHKQHALNFICHDELLAFQVGSFFSQVDSLRLIVSEEPLPEFDVDCYAIHESLLHFVLGHEAGRPATWRPVIGFGPARQLQSAFSLGCADYLKEPWEPEELAVRVTRVFQSRTWMAGGDRRDGIRLFSNKIENNGRCVSLSVNEAKILEVLFASPEKAVPREVLYYAIWGRMKNPVSRVVDVHISSLRKKIQNFIPWEIRHVRGEGYLLTASGSASASRGR